VGTLSESAQRAIRDREAEHRFDVPDYRAAIDEFYGNTCGGIRSRRTWTA